MGKALTAYHHPVVVPMLLLVLTSRGHSTESPYVTMALLIGMAWTTNAKLVGCIYMGCAMAFGISGLLLSWLLRGELGGLGEQLLFGDHHLYNVVVTS